MVCNIPKTLHTCMFYGFFVCHAFSDNALCFMFSPLVHFFFHETIDKFSCVVRNRVFGVSDQVRQNQAVQPQMVVRGLKFRI